MQRTWSAATPARFRRLRWSGRRWSLFASRTRSSRSWVATRWMSSTRRCGSPGGGGALGSRAVRLAVRKTGHLLWLRAPVSLCAERAAAGRPLLAGNPQARLAELAIAREPVYARLADAVLEVVPGAGPQQLAAQAASAVSALEAQRAHR